MTSNDVPIAVRGLVDIIILNVENGTSNIGNIDDGISPFDAAPKISPNRTVVDQSLGIDDGISSLSVNPRVSLNRSSPQQQTHQQQVPARKYLFRAIDSSTF